MRNHNVALCYKTPRRNGAPALFKRQRGVIAVFIEQYFIFHYPHDGIAAGQTVANAITGLLAAMLDDDELFGVIAEQQTRYLAKRSFRALASSSAPIAHSPTLYPCAFRRLSPLDSGQTSASLIFPMSSS